MKNLPFFLVLIIIAFTSCDKGPDCSDTYIPAPSGVFFIKDLDGNNLLGDGLIYNFDDISFGNDRIDIDFFLFDIGDNDLGISFYLSPLQSGEEYILKLNDNEEDVIEFQLRVVEQECDDSIGIDNVMVNGVEISREGNTFTIVK